MRLSLPAANDVRLEIVDTCLLMLHYFDVDNTPIRQWRVQIYKEQTRHL